MNPYSLFRPSKDFQRQTSLTRHSLSFLAHTHHLDVVVVVVVVVGGGGGGGGGFSARCRRLFESHQMRCRVEKREKGEEQQYHLDDEQSALEEFPTSNRSEVRKRKNTENVDDSSLGW